MTDQLTEVQVAEILQSRASTYNFLSHMYRQEVSPSFLSELVEQLASGVVEQAGSEGYRLLGDYAQRIREADLQEVATDLGAEYINLLLGVSASAVSPYESVYTSREHLLMQKARDAVVAEYRKEELTRISEFRHPEDHVAVELEFMSHLCRKAADALEEGDAEAALASLERQQGFLERHLLVWVPRFCQDLAGVARSDFYRGIAGITEEHLAHDGENIAELVAALENMREG